MGSDIYVRQSEIKTWKDCRRRASWQYWDGLVKNNPTPGTADVGTYYHVGIQAHYEGNPDPISAITAHYDKLLPEQKFQFVDTYNLACIMLRGYLEWLETTGADAGFTITGIERELTVPFCTIGDSQIYVTGKVDLEVIDRFDRPLLIDHKSVQTLGQDVMAVMDEQRLTYAILRRLEDGTQYQGAIHNQARRVKRTATAKPPFYGRFEVTYNEQQLRNHYKHMIGTIEEMVRVRKAVEEGADVHGVLPPNPSRDCSWKCSYTSMCKLRDDGSDWEAYKDEWYTVNMPTRGRPRPEEDDLVGS